ncbi:MAG TPA: hypothetical protein VGB54_04875 [Allosphingosinicella sp.]|jgi:hypothetical protein
MMNRPIDGVVVSARLKASAFGQSVYADVTLRRRDGAEQSLGGVMVSDRLSEVLTSGTAGRFFFHDIMGSQGLHAFEPLGGAARIVFPMLVERVFGLLALANLAIVAAWLSANSELQFVPLMLGVLGTIAWATCRGAREAVLHDFKYESRIAASRSHRQAVLRGHG